MAKNIKILLVIALFAIGLASLYTFKSTPAEEDTQIFTCDLGQSTLTVSAKGDQLSFSYGDTQIVGHRNSGNIAYHHEMWPHAEDKQLRFNDGDNSYVIFNRWASPNYEGESAVDYAGLLILKGYDKIDLQLCHDSGAFSPDFDLATLPDDGENLIPEMSSSEPSIDNVLEGLENGELEGEEMMPGAYRDEHGCIPSAGYEWSATKQECVRPWLEEESMNQADDEVLHEIGLITAVEDGAYPMFSVTVEFPKANLTQSFSLNVESASVDPSALYKVIGQYIPFDYTSKLLPNLVEIELNGKHLLGTEADASLKKVTGVLSGAESITASDLPGQVTVSDHAGNQVHFPYYVSPEILIANGKEVTVYYDIRAENVINSMELPSQKSP